MNPREQGDLGERSAAAWLLEQGHGVFVPFGHSPDIDLVAAIDGRLVGVQCKTTTYSRADRWCVALATRGGNQSWSGLVKRFAPSRCDYLFVLAGDGRRWFIPAQRVEGGVGLVLGGPKYAEFEIERGLPIPREAA